MICVSRESALASNHHETMTTTFARCSDSIKRHRLDDAMAILRSQGWKISAVFYAVKNGSDAVKRAVWDIDGSAEQLVAAILADQNA